MRKPIVLTPTEGRRYEMGSMSAIFKADCAETNNAYSISEWWLEPYSKGPGAHSHLEDDVFYVIEGVMSFLIADKWIDAPKGSFILVPAETTHDFENRTSDRTSALNFSIPGNFENHMPSIVDWFKENPLGKTV
jgi:mannose-6-phosphate isomerase-like protein (cupin superfamily)